MKEYGAVVFSLMILNIAVGTGILWLPSAFADLSIGPSIIFTIAISCSSILFARYLWDTTVRTFLLIRLGKVADCSQKTLDTSILDVTKQSKKDHFNQLEEPQINDTNTIAIDQIYQYNQQFVQGSDYFVPNDKVLQLSELCKTYYGQFGFLTYQICFMLYVIGTVWSYGQVISSSLTSVIPMKSLSAFKSSGQTEWTCGSTSEYGDKPYCVHSYLVWCTILFVYTLVMTFINVAEQKHLQILSNSLRFIQLFAVMIVIIYCNVNAFFGTTDDEGNYAPYETHVSPSVKAWNFTGPGMGDLFSSVAFSQVCHDVLPQLFQPVARESQKHINKAINFAFLVVIIFGFIFGISGSLFFGNDGRGLVTLNFVNWSGKSFDPSLVKSASGFVKFISVFIRVLPPIYIITTVPLTTLTIGYNFRSCLPDKFHNVKWVQIVTNLAATVLPFILAYTLRDLGLIISISGLFCAAVLVSPSICLFKAKRLCKLHLGTSKTPFSGFDQDWIIIATWILYLFGTITNIWFLVDSESA